MKNIFLLVGITCSMCLYSQSRNKDYRNILKSKNIYEINAFLRDAHPDDPKRMVLKPRVMAMMEEYIKDAKPGDRKVREMQENLARLKRGPSTKISFEEMSAIIRQKQILKYQKELQAGQAAVAYTPSTPQNVYVAAAASPNTSSSSSTPVIADTEASEFNLLMGANPVEHKNKTVKILNSLFDNDPNAKECIVMIENKSDCNIIVRFEGTGYTKYRLPVPANGDNSIVIQKGDYLMTSIVCGAQYASQKTVQKPLMIALGSSSK